MNRILVWLVLISFLNSTFNSTTSWAGFPCQSQCSNTVNQSDEMKSTCSAAKMSDMSVTSDTVLISLDAVILGLCAAACAQIAIPIAGQISGVLCEGAAFGDQVADLIASTVLATKAGEVTQQMSGIVGGSLGLIMSGAMLRADAKSYKASQAAVKAAAAQTKSAVTTAEKTAAKIAAKKAATGAAGNACMTFAMMVATTASRGASLVQDQRSVSDSCNQVTALLNSRPNATLAVLPGSEAVTGGGASVSGFVQSASQCGNPCTINGTNMDQALNNTVEGAFASAAGGVGNLLSALPDPQGFLDKIQNGDMNGALLGAMPPALGDTGDQLLSAAETAIQEVNGGDPNLAGMGGSGEMNASAAASIYSKASVKSETPDPAKAMTDMVTELLTFIKGGDSAAEQAKLEEQQRLAAAQGALKTMRFGQRGIASSASGVFHDKAQSIFEIVSHRVRLVIPRVLEVSANTTDLLKDLNKDSKLGLK